MSRGAGTAAVARGCRCRIASSVDTPIAGMPSPRANPRAAETEIRMPVKLPGPTPTPRRVRLAHDLPCSARNDSSIGMRCSACPRDIASTWVPTTRPYENKAAAQCAADVSNARSVVSDGNRADLCHFGDIVAQQLLYPHLERQGRGRAPGAGALHVQIHNTAIEAVEGDVAAILGHSRTHAAVQKLLDLAHDFAIFAGMFG